MTAETILYCFIGFVGGSICTTVFLCLVFRATGPKDEAETPKTKEASHD